MNDIIEEIRNYFKVQKELYGRDLILQAPLTDAVPGEKIAEAAPQGQEIKKAEENLNPLQSFYHQIKECKECSLATTRNHFVFGEGSANADLMLVGEAPGRDEDLKGIPFVGRAGQLLTLMLQAINLQRDEVFIANVLKCRPPNNRDPLTEEIEKCEPYLLKQIELISPKLIVTLGRFAAASLLRTKEALGRLRQSVHTYNDVPLIVTYHPAALLRNPQLKRQAWEDLKKISSHLENSN